MPAGAVAGHRLDDVTVTAAIFSALLRHFRYSIADIERFGPQLVLAMLARISSLSAASS
jgi:hypothetical protein